MSLGLFVEGPSDRDAIRILIRNLGYRLRITIKIVKQSEMPLRDKMERNVREMLAERGDIEFVTDGKRLWVKTER